MHRYTVYPTFVDAPNVVLGDESQYVLSHEANATSFLRIDFKGDRVHITVARDNGCGIVLVQHAKKDVGIFVEMYRTQDAEGIVDMLLTRGEVDDTEYVKVAKDHHMRYMP